MINLSTIRTVLVRGIGRGSLIAMKHGPEILLGVGIVGVVTSTVMACKATLKAEAIIVEMEEEFAKVEEVHTTGKLPVVNFAAGGVATPADAALMMQLGAEGVFVGSGIFKSSDPAVRAEAIVKATTHYNNPEILAQVSKNLGEAMPGYDIRQLKPEELLANRGW